MRFHYEEIGIATAKNFAIYDITEKVQSAIETSGIMNGIVILSSKHTTCAVCVNENEERLLEDIRLFFLNLAPPGGGYLHNDLHLRKNIPPDEPENAHAHIIAMMLGNSESLSVHDGMLMLGNYQSVLFIELDGPRNRYVSMMINGSI